MSTTVSRIAKLLGTVCKVQKVGVVQYSKDIFFSPVHFPKILGSIMISGTVAGYCTMEVLHRRRMQRLEEMYEDAWDKNYSYQRITNDANFVNRDQQSLPQMTNNLVRHITKKVVNESYSVSPSV